MPIVRILSPLMPSFFLERMAIERIRHLGSEKRKGGLLEAFIEMAMRKRMIFIY